MERGFDAVAPATHEWTYEPLVCALLAPRGPTSQCHVQTQGGEALGCRVERPMLGCWPASWFVPRSFGSVRACFWPGACQSSRDKELLTELPACRSAVFTIAALHSS